MIQPDPSASLPDGAGPWPLQAGRRIAATMTSSPVSRTLTDVLARPGVRVTISYQSDRSLAAAIQSSVRVIAGTAGARMSAAGPARIAGPAPAAKPSRRARSAVPPQGSYAGGGFDACAAPSAQAMTSWLSSSYRAVGIYIGGVNRACVQANLTSSWLTRIVSQGWHYFPIYPGLQSSCVLASGDAVITTSQAAAEGTAAADDAVNKAMSLGIPPKTPLSFDMEAYGPACDGQVLAFLSAWDGELHQRGYLAGVYESFTNIGALAGAAGSITEPDIIYYADWDGVATTNSSYMPATMWTSHARIHQYRGGHFETHGGVRLDVDSDQLDLGAGAAPPPPDRTGFRPSVAINANGTAEWFARSAGGTITHSWQHPVGTLSWSAMHTVGASPASVTTNPAAVAQKDGSLTVFAGTSSGQIVHAWQQAGFPNGWEWGKPLPVLPGMPLEGTDPAALLLPRGDVAVYQTAVGGAVLVTAQRRPASNAGWIAWGNIGGSCASSPVPLVDGAGKVDVFCVTTGGSMAMIHWNGSYWGGWTILPGSPANLTGVPAAEVNGAGQTELFAATAAGGLDYAWQAGAGGGWTWAGALAGSGAAAGNASVTISGSPSAAVWPAGQVVVYARRTGGQLGVIRQLGGSGQAAWGDWTAVGGLAGGGIAGSPAGWLNTTGAAAAVALDGNRQLDVTSNAGNGWSAWQVVGTGF